MPQKITATDFMRIEIPTDPQFSPDGRQIAFTKRRIDAAKLQYRSEIWVISAEGDTPRKFVGNDDNAGSPRWSPDGSKIAFLSNRGKPKNQIFLIPADGGEATPLTHLETEGTIQAIRWSPDGSKIAFLYRETPEMFRKEAVEERQKKELPPPPRHHTRLQYRLDGFGYYDGTYYQVCVADVATGEVTQLTTGEYSCAPPVWSPDSQTLAFLSNRDEYRDIATPHDVIWTVSVAGGDLTPLPTPLGGKDSLTWSPDGKLFAYAGSPEPEDRWGTCNTRLFLLPATGSETAIDLTGHTDQTLGNTTMGDSHDSGSGDMIQWTADSQSLFFPMSVCGDTRLYSVATAGGTPVPLTPTGHEAGDFTMTPDGRAVVALNSSTMLQELYLLREPAPGGTEVSCEPLTRFNEAFLAEVAVAVPEPLEIPNGEGGRVPAWLLKPTDFDPARQYPLILYIHGGPHGQYGNTFHHEFQALAAEGYVVLYTNPRGSKGYGEAHTKAIASDWGNKDYQDVMKAVDYVAGLEFVDAKRMGIMGGSYGGYMTTWTIGHTDRFACAIADRLVNNLQSMAGTCDFPLNAGTYFKGNAWSDPQEMWLRSPLAYAGNITTPVLIVHSDGDYRCPQGQAEELFTALRLQRKTVEFIRYPVETSHGLSRTGPPGLRLDRIQRNVDWLNRWLK